MAVAFAGVLVLLVGGYHLAHGIGVLVGGGDANRLAEGGLDVALGAAALVIGAAALRLRSWAWVVFMLWGLVVLTHQLLRHFFYGDPDYVAMASAAAVVLALTPLDIQLAFGVRPVNAGLRHEERGSGELS